MLEWWRWVEATAAAALVAALLLLRFDTLKERMPDRVAARRLAPLVLVIPAAFAVALLAPWWMGLIVIAIPAIALLTMQAVD